MLFPEHNTNWTEAAQHLQQQVGDGESVLAPVEFREKLKPDAVLCLSTSRNGDRFQWAVIHKRMLRLMDFGLLAHVVKTFRPVLANGDFIIFTSRAGLPVIDEASPQLRNFMRWLRLLQLFNLTLDMELLLMVPHDSVGRVELCRTLVKGAADRARGLFKRRPVFIHSLWRTGSTYVWSKFRQMPGCCAYYEPFNEQLLKGKREEFEAAFKENITEKMAHPGLDRHYFNEFPLYEEGGAPLFRKSFPYDDYCLAEGDDAPELERYLKFLINCAPGRSVFQFCRSPLRARWLKRNFRSLNIYILRSPREQWESYLSSFPPAVPLTFLIVGKNSSSPLIRPLGKSVDIPYFDDWDINKEINFYKEIAAGFQPLERYRVFYYLWAVSLLEAAGVCDAIVDIDLISRDKGAAGAVSGFLRGHSLSMDLSDCRIKRYSAYTLPAEEMDKVEDEVLGLVGRELGHIFRKNGRRYGRLAGSLSPEHARLIEHFI